MERREHDHGGKGNPYEDPDIKDTEDCGIIVSMKTLENKALRRICRKDLTLSANGVVITTLYNSGYYPYFAKPGEIEFSAKTESTSSVTLDVKTGQVYYIKGIIGIGFFVGRPHLTVESPEVGEKEIAKCKLIPEKKEDE